MRRVAMEFVGTFFLTLAITLIANPIAIGLMLMAMIYVGGHISGAHFNPAVSFVCLLQKRLALNDMAKYMLGQCLGAFLAMLIFGLITSGSTFTLDMMQGSSLVGPLLIEALLVLVFCWVYLNMNLNIRYKDTAVPGVVLGLTLLAIATAGGLYNPAVAVASYGYSMVGDINTVIVYVVGPLLGSLGASFLFDYFKPQL